MPDNSLQLDISKSALHSIEPAVEAFETDGSFTVLLRNHGRSVHVHCNLDDDLASVASIEETNHFVETDSTTGVRVEVAPDAPRPVSGRLKLVTGYGAEEKFVPVKLVDSRGVESRTVPEAASTEPSRSSSVERPIDLDGSLPIVALAGVALLLAVLAFVFANSLAVMLGVLVVLGGIVAALVLLYR
ncbi:DUF7524 family protein [Haloarchaeobius sp. TZWWS8]|uniref:DUF7524 family protein n=1 Tax=Haloarchaeobius sp. TZWWS8 TaxID=3446121 RepID=UPI003EBDA54C